MSRLARALFRVALRTLPPWLREKHGRAMLAELDARLAAESSSMRRTLLALGAAWDALRRGVYEHTRAPARPRASDPISPPDPPGSWTMDLPREIHHAARSLWRAPRFTLLAVATLALGIGATTGIFSVIYGVMLRPLPFPEPERFAHVGMQGDSYVQGWMPYFRVDWLRRNAEGFEAVSTFSSYTARFERDGRPEGRQGLRADRGFFEVIGIEPILGRGFVDPEFVPGGPSVAVLGHGFWASRFEGDVEVLGRTLDIEGEPHTIVGVMPERFAMPQVDGLDAAVELITPLRIIPDPMDEGANWPVIARRADGVSREAAQAGLTRAWEALRDAHPDLIEQRERGVVLTSFQALYVGGLQTVLWMIGAAVVVVLAVACANVANLMLARSAQRRRDSVVRAALGAGRGALLRYQVIEALLIAGLAAVLGVGLAHVSVDALLAMAPFDLPRVNDVGVRGGALGFAVLTALVTGLGVGLVSGLAGTRVELARGLQEGSRGNSASGPIRGALVAVQAAFSVVLLVGAAMLLSSVANLRGIETGFDPEGLLAVSFPLAPTGYETWAEVEELGRRIEARLGRGPEGSSSVFTVSSLPMRRGLNIPMERAGSSEDGVGAVEWRAVDPGYFEALGIDVLRGRTLTDADAAGLPPVAVVNEAFVSRFFPEHDALGGGIDIGRFRGRFLVPSFERPSAQIVGVVRDVRDRSFKDPPRLTVYVPVAQAHDEFLGPPVFLVRGGRSAGEIGSVASAVRDADPRVPEPEVERLSKVMAESMAADRFNATLLSTFAALALVLTAMGIYGVIAYTVRQRRREIGIRLALGAEGGSVARMVARQGMIPVALGLLGGAVAAVLLSRYITSLVWEVSPYDPVTLGAVAVVLLGVSGLASWLPAREATRVDPVRTLSAD